VDRFIYGQLHTSLHHGQIYCETFSPGSVGAQSESNEPEEKENKNTLSVTH